MFKKILMCIITAIMLTGIMPFAAMADEAVTDATNTQKSGFLPPEIHYVEPGVSFYTGEEVDINVPLYSTVDGAAEVLRETFVAHGDILSFRLPTSIGTDAEQLFNDVYYKSVEHTGVANEGDYIEFTLDGFYCSLTEGTDWDFYLFTIEPIYRTTYEQELELSTEVTKLIKSLDLDGKTEYQKICAIYDYMCENIRYDYDSPADYRPQYTAYAALIDKKAVCQGYATLFYRIALEAGVDARAIPSVNYENHIWNIAKIGRWYYNLDATWDEGKTEYEYFLRGSTDFPDHTRMAQYDTAEFNKAYPVPETAYVPGEDIVVPLSTPVLTAANIASTGKIKVSWNAVSGATKYTLYHSTTGKTGSWTAVNTTKTSITHSSAKAGTKYYYKVRAIAADSRENSALSAAVARVCDLAQPVVTTANVTSTGKIKISWNAVDGASKYILYRSTTGKTGSWTAVNVAATKTSIIHSSAKAGTKYYYKVRAISTNSSANSAYSAAKTCTCDLARPTVSVKLNSRGKPVISWNKVDGASKYILYRSTTGKTGSWTAVNVAATKTSITHSSATAGTKYYYKVKVVHANTDANSALSTAVNITSK